MSPMLRSSELINNPLFRFFQRENQIARDAFKIVKNDLASLTAVCNGETSQTNRIRSLIASLNKGTLNHIKVR